MSEEHRSTRPAAQPPRAGDEPSTASAWLRPWIELTRPFTLLVPALGFVAGTLCAMAVAGDRLAVHGWGRFLWPAALGALMAATLNVASNTLNQITDLEQDRINKPDRPLPSGRISIAGAGTISAVAYAAALVLAWLVTYPPAPGSDPARAPWWRGHDCFWVVVLGLLFTLAYSVPPLRTKRHWLLANLTIAIPRGMLLKVAGWSAAAPVFSDTEPWVLGGIFFLFLVGASTTKDFADVEGDLAAGCRTMPARFGPRIAAWWVAPFLVLPFLLLPLLTWTGWLEADPRAMTVLGIVLALYGAWTGWGILRDPEALAVEANHPSWKHMYLMMLCAQAGTVAGYWL